MHPFHPIHERQSKKKKKADNYVVNKKKHSIPLLELKLEGWGGLKQKIERPRKKKRKQKDKV